MSEITTNETIESRLVEQNLAMLAAEQGASVTDLDYLTTVIAHDLVFRRADESVVDKAGFLRNVPSAARALTGRCAKDVEVHVQGNSALVTLTVTAVADVESRREARAFYNIRFFVEREGRWQLQHWFNTRIAERPDVT